MTAREWKPGDRALVEVEVVRSHEGGSAVLIVGPKSELHPEGWRQYALMDDDALRPVPAAGEAATEVEVELLHTYDPETHVPVERAPSADSVLVRELRLGLGLTCPDEYTAIALRSALAALADGAES